MVLDFAWTIGTIASMAALLYGAYLSLMESESIRGLLGKEPRLTGLSTEILGKESRSVAMDLSC